MLLFVHPGLLAMLVAGMLLGGIALWQSFVQPGDATSERLPLVQQEDEKQRQWVGLCGLTVLVLVLASLLVLLCVHTAPALVFGPVMGHVLHGEGWSWRPSAATLHSLSPQCTLASVVPSSDCPPDEPLADRFCRIRPGPAFHGRNAQTGQCVCDRLAGSPTHSASGVPWGAAAERCVHNRPPMQEGANTSPQPVAAPRVSFVTAYAAVGRRDNDDCVYMRRFAQWAQVDMHLIMFASPQVLPLMEGVRRHHGRANQTASCRAAHTRDARHPQWRSVPRHRTLSLAEPPPGPRCCATGERAARRRLCRLAVWGAAAAHVRKRAQLVRGSRANHTRVQLQARRAPTPVRSALGAPPSGAVRVRACAIAGAGAALSAASPPACPSTSPPSTASSITQRLASSCKRSRPTHSAPTSSSGSMLAPATASAPSDRRGAHARRWARTRRSRSQRPTPSASRSRQRPATFQARAHAAMRMRHVHVHARTCARAHVLL